MLLPDVQNVSGQFANLHIFTTSSGRKDCGPKISLTSLRDPISQYDFQDFHVSSLFLISFYATQAHKSNIFMTVDDCIPKFFFNQINVKFDLNILPLEAQLLIPKQLVLKHFVFLVQMNIKRIRLDHKKCALLAFLNPLIGLV